MSIHDEMMFLREVPPFTDLDPVKLELLAFMSERLAYSAGETVLKQGDEGDAVYVLIEGIVYVVISCEEAAPQVCELGHHAFFGELAVIRATVRAATISAKTDIVVLKIPQDVLHKMIEDHPELGLQIAEHIKNAGYGLD